MLQPLSLLLHFLFVIPEGDLLLHLPCRCICLSCLSSPKGTCFCRCICSSCLSSRRDLLLPLQLSLSLLLLLPLHLGTPRLQPWASQPPFKKRGFSPWGMPSHPLHPKRPNTKPAKPKTNSPTTLPKAPFPSTLPTPTSNPPQPLPSAHATPTKPQAPQAKQTTTNNPATTKQSEIEPDKTSKAKA